jgi:hypothetical protein
MVCRAPGSAWTDDTAARTGSVAGCADHSGTLNCDWPPGRRRNITSSRATACAASRPWSSSTSASARSIPAVTPADVHTFPSWTKIGSQSTASPGYSVRSCSSRPQCVVTRRPSRTPASASSNAPLHTDATRRAVRAACATQSTSAVAPRAAATPTPPATTSVSMPSGARSVSKAAWTRSPPDAGTGPTRGPTTRHSYRPVASNTSCGPVRSRIWKPS